jgi:hypothetical protein
METKTIDNFEINQCKKLEVTPLEDISLSFEDEAAPHEVTIDDSTFLNDGSSCLIESCTFHTAGDCGGETFSAPGELVLPTESPWTI